MVILQPVNSAAELRFDIAELPVVVLTQSKVTISAAGPGGASTRPPGNDEVVVADK